MSKLWVMVKFRETPPWSHKESDTTEQLSTQPRKEIKLSLLGDDMILYMADPKDTPGKLLEFINEFYKDL